MRCKQGDLAIIECGAFGADSPNVGLVVECVSLVPGPEHSVFGPIWNIKTDGPRQIVTEYGATGLVGHCADEWLRPIPKEQKHLPQPPQAVNDPNYDKVKA